MGFLPDEPRPELSTQRVPGGRRAATVVAVVATLVVGMLIWKPWGSGAPAATPGSSTHPVAALPSPTAVPTPLVVGVDPNRPAASAQPEPTDGSADGHVFPADGNLGSVAFFPGREATVHCIYKAAAPSDQATLETMIVEPPVIMLQADSAAHSIKWHVALESNTEDKLFESAWLPVRDSKVKRATAAHGDILTFGAISMAVPPADSTTTYRATLVVDWFDQRGRLLTTQHIHPTSYGPLGDANFPLGPSGCAAVI